MNRSRLAALVLAGALAFAACGDDDTSADELPTDDASGDVGTCLAGDPECEDFDDTPGDEPMPGPADDEPAAGDEPAEEPSDDSGSPVAGRCLPEEPDCTDTGVVAPGEEDPMPADEPADEASADDRYRERAKALLGTPEGELADDVRVGRRGEEQYALTQDYVVGRMTVELDDDGTGTFVVVLVIAELNEGPETFTAGG